MAARPLPLEPFQRRTTTDYVFNGGFPTPETVQRAYDEADLNRAISAYRFFYPTVSGAAIFKGNAKLGIVPNKIFGTLDTEPKPAGFTLNSDTPYAPVLLDLKDGPIVVELPPGPLIVVCMDINQRWVADMGVPGPNAGKGDKFVPCLPITRARFLPGIFRRRPLRIECSWESVRCQ